MGFLVAYLIILAFFGAIFAGALYINKRYIDSLPRD